MEYVIYVIVYLTGVIFDIVVIAYLNERKGSMFFYELAFISWTGLLVFLLNAIDTALKSIYNYFCFLFSKDTQQSYHI